MDAVKFLTSEDVRAILLMRARAFRDTSGQSFSAMSLAIANDSKLLSRIEQGGNFTVEMFQRVMDWLAEHEAASRRAIAPAQAGAAA